MGPTCWTIKAYSTSLQWTLWIGKGRHVLTSSPYKDGLEQKRKKNNKTSDRTGKAKSFINILEYAYLLTFGNSQMNDN